TTGDLDPSFGSAGICRHDGLGCADVLAVGPTGRVWTAGIAELFLGPASNPQFMNILTISQWNTNGELESAFGLEGIAGYQLPQWDGPSVISIIPLANGSAVVNGTATLYGVTPTTAGSWILRVLSDGRIDSTFGGGRRPTGSVFYVGRDIRLLSELSTGTLQGFETGDVVSVGVNGVPATVRTVSRPLVNEPFAIEPNGDFLALVFGKVTSPFEVGLVRFQNGAIDP